jgi:hypothetical protein
METMDSVPPAIARNTSAIAAGMDTDRCAIRRIVSVLVGGGVGRRWRIAGGPDTDRCALTGTAVVASAGSHGLTDGGGGSAAGAAGRGSHRLSGEAAASSARGVSTVAASLGRACPLASLGRTSPLASLGRTSPLARADASSKRARSRSRISSLYSTAFVSARRRIAERAVGSRRLVTRAGPSTSPVFAVRRCSPSRCVGAAVAGDRVDEPLAPQPRVRQAARVDDLEVAA